MKNVSFARIEDVGAEMVALVKRPFSCLIAKRRDFWNSSVDQDIFQMHSQKEEYLSSVGIQSMVQLSIYLDLQLSTQS